MKSIAVIGLDRFGYTLAVTLSQLGHQVLCIDENEKAIQSVADQVTNAVCANTTNEAALRAAGIKSFDSAVICISDPLRAEAKAAIKALHDCGIKRVVMMTGDNERTAAAVAASVGVDEYHAEVLPEDKANYIRKAKAEGHKVIMIGDGVNDSPALSEADAGIAIGTGAAIAKEIADITISSEDLFELVTLRKLSKALMERIDRNYRFIVGFNLGLIICGVSGVMLPTTSALLHNMSTLAISLHSMTNLLPEEE